MPSPYTEEHAGAWLATEVDGVRLLVVDGEDRLLGTVALMEVDLSRGYAEIGYWLAAEARGRGVASGAVALLRDWAAAELGLTLVEIIVHRDNTASLGVPLRAGFERTGELREAPARMERTTGPVYVVFAWSAT